MTIEERVKLAEEKHHSGYNCAQAVLCSYSDKLGIDEETLFRLSEGFGAGWQICREPVVQQPECI